MTFSEIAKKGIDIYMENKMSKKKKIWLAVFAVIVLALLVGVIGYMAGWFDKGYDADVITVAKRNLTATFDTSGTVSSSGEASFSVVPDIVVKSVDVKVGERVKAGQVLATFDASSLDSALKEKQDALEKAQKAYNDYKSGAADAKSRLSSLDSQIAQAEKKVAQLEKESKQAQQAAKAQEQAQSKEAQQAQDNLSGIINDSTLAGKIIDNIVNSSQSLQQLKSILNSISSMNNSSQFSSIMSSMGTSSAQYELVQAQIELASLKANRTLAETQANGNLESVYKSVYDASLEGYNKMKETVDTLNAGWTAAHDGIVSEINITAGEAVKAPENSSSGTFDVSSIVSAVTSGSDISKLVSGFFASDIAGMKVQYFPLEVKFMINKGDLEKVKLGQSVNVESASGEILKGEVTYIAAVATASSGLDVASLLGGASGGASGGIETVVSVKEPDSGLIIGLDADVSIDVDTKQGCLTVPVESIQYDENTAYVFVYDPQEKTLLRKDVTTGIFNGTYYEITSGISEGDIIVRTPTAQMAEGDKVIAHNVD